MIRKAAIGFVVLFAFALGLAFSGPIGQSIFQWVAPPAQAAATQQLWQNKCLVFNLTMMDSDDLTSKIDALASQGWELVTGSAGSRGPAVLGYYCFKKPR